MPRPTILLVSLLFGALAQPGFAQGEATVLTHDLVLRIDPEASSFRSIDTVTVRGPGRLPLATLKGVTVDGPREVAAGTHQITVKFTGTIQNPVKRSSARRWVAGDTTPGTISGEGSYLVRGFCVGGDTPAKFRVTIEVPLPHRAVAQGRRIAESEKDGVYRVTYESATPADGLTVATGPWVIDEAEIDGIACRTYLYEADRKHAAMLLATLREEVPRYQAMLGAVPDGRFDVVENFFATGYGFPNWTLLGDTVIRYVCAKTARSGQKTLPSGYLDHELVHCWLGNGLLVDYEKGNWCEALTTWFSNYGSAVRAGTDVAYRRKVSRSFSLRVSPKNDYPVRAFKSKTHAHENDIGYGKGSMVFQMCAHRLGREKFIEAVRGVVATHLGKKLGWDGFVAALSKAAGRDLKLWFAPWLSRTGGPILRFGVVKVEGAIVTGTIIQAQDGPAYPLRIPIQIRAADGRETRIVLSASKETAFRFAAKGQPSSLHIDPDHTLFRVLPRDQVAPCLEAVLTAEKHAGFGDKALLGQLGITAMQPDAALAQNIAVLGLGIPETLRPAMQEAARRHDPTLKLEAASFTVQGKTYGEAGDGLLFSYARSGRPPVTFFHGNGKAAFARTHYLPYYAAQSWVVFRHGRPIARGTFAGDRAARADITKARFGPPESLIADLLWLTEKRHGGRRAGSMAAYKLANDLRGRVVRAGLKLLAWPPVNVPEPRCQRRCITTPALHDNVLFPFHATSLSNQTVKFKRVERHPAKQPKGTLVLLPEEADFALAQKYADAGAAAVAVVSSDQAFTKRGKEATWLGAVPPSVKLRGADKALAIAGLFARSHGARLKIPYVYLRPDIAQKLKPGTEGTVCTKISVAMKQTANIVGVLGDPRQPGILLSAHWDGVGKTQAASDNAAGVAVVLRVAARLKRDLDAGKLKRPVVVALFGAEEAGLWGSRQFAGVLRSPSSPLAKPVAQINVDGVGSHAEKKAYLIGRSKYPKLLAAFQASLKGGPLTLGKDIDRFAYRHGSDHWSLHRIGVPAVTVYSANYRAMNTPLDTIELVDVGTLREIANAVYKTVRKLAME